MRTFHYKTLKGFMRANGIRQFTLLDSYSKSIYSSKHGWINYELSEEALYEFFKGIAGVIWSRVDNERIRRVRYGRSMGILSRLWLDNRGHYTYCAGQDYPSEIRYIQRHI